MEERSQYIIEGGEAGKKRLDILGEILNPYTKTVIEKNGSIEGKRFLDLGCGGGSVSLMVAGMVGPAGSVTAIDFDKDIIALAAADAKNKGIGNISFRSMDAYDLDHENEFDIVYARFLLSHLQQPGLVLDKLHNSLKPGGMMFIEDIDFSGHFSYPDCRAFDLYQHYYVTAAKNNGHDPYIGRSLYRMLQSRHLGHVMFDVIRPCFSESNGKWMAYFTFDKIRETLIRQSLLGAKEAERILAELKAFTEDNDTIISLPRIFRAWGTKHTGAPC